jgi:RNA polymerase sigma factor (sigma-70 family)
MERAAQTRVGRVVGELMELEELYASSAGQVRRQVRSDVHATEAVIDDACQVAWIRLLHHRERVRRDAAVSWLVTTAVHEAFKLIRRDSRDVSLEMLVDEAGDAPATDMAMGPSAEETVSYRLRLEEMQSLSERQRRLLWLKGLGFSYAEIRSHTGDSERTVERQLTRARHRLAAPA